MRKISAVIFYTQDNKVLLMQRTDDAPIYPGYWSLVGGHMENKETPEETLIREVKEELEINIENYEYFKEYRYTNPVGEMTRHQFIAPLVHGLEQLKNQQKEGQDLDIFSENEIKDLKLSEENKKILKEIFLYLKNGKN